MKRVLIFIGLKVAEIAVMILLGALLSVLLTPVFDLCNRMFLLIVAILLSVGWTIFALKIVLKANWYWAGEIAKRGK